MGEEYDDTPHDFGRLAAATARQVISQLFRKAEDDKVFGAFSGQKGKLITGIVQQDVKDTSNVHVAVGDVAGPVPYFQDLLYEVIPSAWPNGHSQILV